MLAYIIRRLLMGIPTVLDRLIQQALLQVLSPLYDPTFSDSSFGLRPGRSAHDALDRAKQHVSEGYRWVVDMDLEKFFDRVNHDILMSRLARRASSTPSTVLILLCRMPGFARIASRSWSKRSRSAKCSSASSR